MTSGLRPKPGPAADDPADSEATTINAGGASLDCALVPWDTRIFGFPVAEIRRLALGSDRPGDAEGEAGTAGADDSSALLAAFDAWCTANGVRLAACRLDHLQLAESMALEANGFRFIETVYRPRLDELGAPSGAPTGVTIQPATAADASAIQAIAAEVFATGRFRLDHRLPPELSGRRYAEWVRTAFHDDRQSVLTAAIDGALAGFFIVERRPDDSMYWHLTALGSAFQGRGVGLRVWRSMIDLHAAAGVTSIETTISGHNLAVMNLYARLGFRLSSSAMTFHRVIAP